MITSGLWMHHCQEMTRINVCSRVVYILLSPIELHRLSNQFSRRHFQHLYLLWLSLILANSSLLTEVSLRSVPGESARTRPTPAHPEDTQQTATLWQDNVREHRGDGSESTVRESMQQHNLVAGFGAYFKPNFTWE